MSLPLWFLCSPARAEWPATVAWGGGFADAVTVRPSDVDGDGDLDVVSGSWSGDTLFWIPNDGAGGFGGLVPIDAGVDAPRRVRLGDLDGDGDDDLVVTRAGGLPPGDEDVRWYENTGGAFGPATVLDTPSGDLGPALADVDADGDLDVLVAAQVEGEIRWYANDGAGGFAPAVVVAHAVGATDVAVADLDADGLVDLAVAGWAFGGETRWFRGLGGGAFAAGIAFLNGYEKVVAPVDLDADGDVDLGVGNDGIVGYKEALGGGDFGDPTTYWGFALTGVASLVPADLDGDGVFGLVWAEDPGPVWWVPDVAVDPVAVGPASAWDACPADLDGDGWDDVVSASTTTGLSWTPNLGAGGFGATRRVSTSANTVALAAGDLDGDGDADLVTGTDGVSWFPVDGGVGAAVSVTADPIEPERVALGDLDGDGALDVLAAAYRTGATPVRGAFWYRQGPGGFEPAVALDDRCDQSVVAADLDGDADLDVLCAGFYTLVWQKNLGDGTFGSRRPIDRFQTLRADVLDVEGDGDLDVLAVRDDELDCATCYYGYRYVQAVTWYANDGAGGFGPGVDVSVVEDDYETVTVTADLDGDGGDDVLVASPRGGLRWYPNLGASFGPAVPLPPAGAEAAGVAAVDRDGDGDLDVVASFRNPGVVVVYPNDGRGAFGPIEVVDGDAADPGALVATDVDGDGLSDAVALLAGADGLVWYANPGDAPPAHTGDTGDTSDTGATGHTGTSTPTTTDDGGGDPPPVRDERDGCGCAVGGGGGGLPWLLALAAWRRRAITFAR